MLTLRLDDREVLQEIERLVGFLREEVGTGERAVLGISGGLDSDVVARLAAQALGARRLKLFIILQEDQDPRHVEQARRLAGDLACPLAEIDLRALPRSLVAALAAADPDEKFRPDGLLDPSRAKCSLRTTVLSSYQDRGCAVLGTSNRTERETGFFLPLGDGIWHVGPIVHLYKTQVCQLAAGLGTRREVLEQPPSAGFWVGEEDLEDLAYWLQHGGPIGPEVAFDSDAERHVRAIRGELTAERVDLGLLGLAHGLDNAAVSSLSGLSAAVVERLRRLREAAARCKHRPLGRRLPDRCRKVEERHGERTAPAPRG